MTSGKSSNRKHTGGTFPPPFPTARLLVRYALTSIVERRRPSPALSRHPVSHDCAAFRTNPALVPRQVVPAIRAGRITRRTLGQPIRPRQRQHRDRDEDEQPPTR